jgi:hypothetical protein
VRRSICRFHRRLSPEPSLFLSGASVKEIKEKFKGKSLIETLSTAHYRRFLEEQAYRRAQTMAREQQAQTRFLGEAYSAFLWKMKYSSTLAVREGYGRRVPYTSLPTRLHSTCRGCLAGKVIFPEGVDEDP